MFSTVSLLKLPKSGFLYLFHFAMFWTNGTMVLVRWYHLELSQISLYIVMRFNDYCHEGDWFWSIDAGCFLLPAFLLLQSAQGEWCRLIILKSLRTWYLELTFTPIRMSFDKNYNNYKLTTKTDIFIAQTIGSKSISQYDHEVKTRE